MNDYDRSDEYVNDYDRSDKYMNDYERSNEYMMIMTEVMNIWMIW